MDEERRKNGCGVEPSCMRRTNTVEGSSGWVATRWILRLISHVNIHPFSIHPLCLLPRFGEGIRGGESTHVDEKKMKRVQVRKKKEGRKKDLRLSRLYHHPPSSPASQPSHSPVRPTSPHPSDSDSSGTRVPSGHRRFGVRRTWRVRVAGRACEVMTHGRLCCTRLGLSPSSAETCRLLLLLELLPPFLPYNTFCTAACNPPPLEIHISHVHLPSQRHAPRRLLFLPPPALRSSHEDPPPRKLLSRASIPRPSPTCTDPARRLKTRDLQLMFKEWDNDKGGYRIKWLDDTNALVVFADAIVGVSGSIPFVVCEAKRGIHS